MNMVQRVLVVVSVSGMVSACATTNPCPCAEDASTTERNERSSMEAPQEVEEATANDVKPVVRAYGEAPRHIAPGGRVAVSRLAEGANAYVGEISIAPETEVPIHTHDSEEYLFFIEGGGVMIIDGEDYEVGPGMIVAVPEGAEHGFINGPEGSVAFQIFAGPEGAQRYRQWPVDDGE